MDFNKQKYEEMANIAKALAHATRLFIVEQLSKKEICVKDITKMVNADISTVSKHLSVLKNAGIVSNEKRGNCIYYKLECPCVLNIFGCVVGVIKQNTEKQIKSMNLL